MSLQLTTATRADSALILTLINELAVYEKLHHEVVASVKDIEDSLFGEHPGATVILASWQQKPVGFALYFYNYSTFLGRKGIHLEDLYVQVEHRGRGIGKALLSHLGKIAIKEQCGRLEWSVLDWNTSAIEFYQSLGAKPLHGWTGYRVTTDSLTELAKLS